MEIKDIKTIWKQQLAGLYPQEEVLSLFYLVVEKKFGWSRLSLALQVQKELKMSEEAYLNEVLLHLKAGAPIQYILGETEFYGLPFTVNQHVLIPRPETEELVSWVLEDYKSIPPKILDIGTGSGCIPITLAKKQPQAQVFAVDVSEEALKVARENAEKNQVKVHFSKVDILDPIYKETEFDCIISNPPYVRLSEKEMMRKNVLDHEPGLALFVEDDDPLLFYRKILEFAKQHLRKDGVVYFEVNEFLKADLQVLFKEKACESVEFRKDGFDKLRMVKLQLGRY